MPWSDFQAPANQTVTSNVWTTLENSVQQHGLILAWAAHYDPYGSSPTVKLSGTPLHIVLELPVQPYRTWFPYDRWYWYYSVYGIYPTYAWLASLYYYGVYPWWTQHWWWWWSGHWQVTGTLVIAFADAAGTVKMEALGAQAAIQQKLTIWNTVITPGENQAITRVNFQRNNTLPQFSASRYVGKMQVNQDDLVVLMGANYDTYYAQLSLDAIVPPSPSVQVLLNETITRGTWPYGSFSVRLMRMKGSGTLNFTWNYAHAGISAIRLTPNVEERTVVFPNIPGGQKLYFELQVLEDAFGNHNYPREFLALVDQVKGSRNWGQFQSWKREETDIVRDDRGREVFSGWKFVEFWMVPNSYYTQVQAIPNVLVMETFTKMAARKLYHDQGW